VILHRTTIAFKVEILRFSLIVLMSDAERCSPDRAKRNSSPGMSSPYNHSTCEAGLQRPTSISIATFKL